MAGKVEGALGIFVVFIVAGVALNVVSVANEPMNNQTNYPEFKCVRIETVSGGEVFIRNCGRGDLKAEDLSAYLNGKSIDFSLNKSLKEGNVGKLKLNGIDLNDCSQKTVKLTTEGVSDKKTFRVCNN